MADLSKLLKNIEYLFIALTVVSFGYMGYFLLMKNNPEALPVAVTSSKQGVEQAIQEFLLPTEKPYDTYSKNINTRDIFTQASVTPVKDAIPSGQLPNNFKVVGIVMGNPVQIIVEDSSTHETYFIDKTAPQGGISIDRIEQGKVFLNYQGQTIAVALQGSKINVSKQDPKIN